jgi:hypothetical protein
MAVYAASDAARGRRRRLRSTDTLETDTQVFATTEATRSSPWLLVFPERCVLGLTVRCH